MPPAGRGSPHSTSGTRRSAPTAASPCPLQHKPKWASRRGICAQQNRTNLQDGCPNISHSFEASDAAQLFRILPLMNQLNGITLATLDYLNLKKHRENYSYFYAYSILLVIRLDTRGPPTYRSLVCPASLPAPRHPGLSWGSHSDQMLPVLPPPCTFITINQVKVFKMDCKLTPIYQPSISF